MQRLLTGSSRLESVQLALSHGPAARTEAELTLTTEGSDRDQVLILAADRT